MDLDPIYRALADGTATEPAPRHQARPLQRMALEAARSPRVEDRLGALRIAAALGLSHGLAITRELLRDPDPRVLRHAFNQVVAARADGILLLRHAAEAPDADLSLEALELLTVRVDRGAAPITRRLVASPDPRVRAAAVRLMGLIAGPSARAQIARLSDDTDEAVRGAAAEALERIDAGEPPPPEGQWWDDAPFDALPSPPPLDPTEPEPEPEPSGAAEPEPSGATEPEAGASDAAEPDATEPEASDAAEAVDAAPTEGSEPPSEHALVPVAGEEPDETALAVPEPADTGDGIGLPSPMPTEARALLRLLGLVAEAHRPAVLSALEEVADGLPELLARYRSGGDEALGRGLGLAAVVLGGPTWLTRLRPLLEAPQAPVRAAVLDAFAAHGSAGAIPGVAGRLADPAPEVRLAAVRATRALCERSDRAALGLQRLADLAEDPDPAVRTAVTTALEGLS